MNTALPFSLGNAKDLGRAIRMVEDGDDAIEELLHELRMQQRTSYVVGITGPPGSGKSTLTDQIIAEWRARNHTVGVLAVDPSSPFTGGAVLGDRIRMQRHVLDPEVYIRSLAARGHLGGLAAAVRDAIRLLDAAGKDRSIVETVGVGQSELEVMECADTTVVVVTPVTGDSIQAIKAGILEIADIFVVNKADVEGAERVLRELRELLRQKGAVREDGWKVPVIKTTASRGEGIVTLTDALEAHYEHMTASGELVARRKRQRTAEIEAIVVDHALQAVRAALAAGGAFSAAVEDEDPNDVAESILRHAFTAMGGTEHAGSA